MSELKPCPRCGAEAHVVTEDGEPTMFLCEDCGSWLDVSEFETTENAFKWWNDRPFIDALNARIAELEHELSNKEIEYTDLWDDALEMQSRIAELEAENERLSQLLHDEMSQLEIATDLGNKRWIALNEIYEKSEKHSAWWCKRKAQEGLGIK